MQTSRYLRFTGALALAAAGVIAVALPAAAATNLPAPTTSKPIVLDGKTNDWKDISGITVPLKRDGGVASVNIKAAVRGDTIYFLAVWEDPDRSDMHKPYKWDDASSSYKATKQGEDRFAISLAMSGDFSADKMDGSEFTADVWYWKSSRSNPAGLAHDKMWRVAKNRFKRAKRFRTPDGSGVFLRRSSDAGDKLYKSVKYDTKDQEMMPRYKVNMAAKGSIADVKARGVWRNGRWYLELARKLNTGHADDAVIPASGTIEITLAAATGTTGGKHSVSEKLILVTGPRARQLSQSKN